MAFHYHTGFFWSGYKQKREGIRQSPEGNVSHRALSTIFALPWNQIFSDFKALLHLRKLTEQCFTHQIHPGDVERPLVHVPLQGSR